MVYTWGCAAFSCLKLNVFDFFWCIAVKPLVPEEELQDDEETKELIMQILQRIAP
jgi:hypothetical protein